ncbi:MAG TPA: hypothetical protein VJN93_08365 [Candidatus Acidoferrum sp.]|nr:hypothetical protein [Candidatus Acidoferrum sp.]
MKKQTIAWALGIGIILSASIFFGYQRWSGLKEPARDELLARMPADATTVLYFDLDALRQSPFLSELYKWAPQNKQDADYLRFLQSTGFNYETDLHRVAMSFLNRGPQTTVFAIADGRFDHKKISAYALQSGSRISRDGHEIFAVPFSEESRQIMFTFLRSDRIALTNSGDLSNFLARAQEDPDTQAWRVRFRRLAGSPVFAVIRREASPGTVWSGEAPGGLQSPQLASLLNQLAWISVAGKPEGDRMRVVIEGEAVAEGPARQLSDVLSGLLLLAQGGLSQPKMRQQLDPDVRDAYLELLRSADVSQIDRGDTKSVRLMFDLSPKFLEAARTPVPQTSGPAPAKSSAHKGAIQN